MQTADVWKMILVLGMMTVWCNGDTYAEDRSGPACQCATLTEWRISIR